MHRRFTRSAAITAAAALALAGCGGDGDDDEQAGPESEDVENLDDEELDGQQDTEDLEDPNEDVEDGVYRGAGVILPVPEGWSLDPTAFQQGLVAALSEDQSQQMTAQAIDVSQAEEMGQSMDLDSVLEDVRSQIEQLGTEPEVDEEIELQGAERAHRLTFLDLPAQQEGAPESSATLILAEDGNGLVGEFAFQASAEDYDESLEQLLIETAGFDPDSEPPEPTMPQPPMPEEGGGDGTQPPEGEDGTPPPEDGDGTQSPEDEDGTQPSGDEED